jgi:hypothetical protein
LRVPLLVLAILASGPVAARPPAGAPRAVRHDPPPIHLVISVGPDRVTIQMHCWEDLFVALVGGPSAEAQEAEAGARARLDARAKAAFDRLFSLESPEGSLEVASYVCTPGSEFTDGIPYGSVHYTLPVASALERLELLVRATTWDELQEQLVFKIPLLLEVEQGSGELFTGELTREEPAWTWLRPHRREDRIAVEGLPAASPRTERAPRRVPGAALLGLLLALGSGAWALRAGRARETLAPPPPPSDLSRPAPRPPRGRSGLGWGLAGVWLALALTGYLWRAPWSWWAVAPAPAPAFAPPTPAEARAILEELHARLYSAFDADDEEEIYRVLSGCVHEAILPRVYRDVHESLVLRDQGGARAKVSFREIKRCVLDLPQALGPTEAPHFSAGLRWRVQGRVAHFGHEHLRTNDYMGRFSVWSTPDDTAAPWKITRIEITDQRRVGPDGGVFGR